MMLQALIAYAERENLGDPDFEPVGVRWLIPLTADGKLATAPIPIFENPDEKKPRPKRLTRPKSDPDFVSHGRSYFLCDSLERSLLYVEDADKLEKRRVNQAYFIGLLQDAAESCPTVAAHLSALVNFLQDPDELDRLHKLLQAAKAKGSDNAAFSVDGTELLGNIEVEGYWRARSASERAKDDVEAEMCLASGKVGAVCRTTGFIKLLGEDTKLISFNKECPAFESFGLSQAANAPVSFDAEVKFRSALNRLIEISREQRLVFNSSVYLHWTRQPVDFDPLDPVISGDPSMIERLLTSVQRGQPPVGVDANAYYALSLSGNGARVVVRDWVESTVPEVERHVADWFKDLSIVPPEGVGLKRDFKFGALLYGMVRADLDELPPQLPTQLLHAALHGTPLPQTALVAALRRQQLEQRKPDEKSDPKLTPARIALIKACLLRTPTETPNPKETMTECLNPDSRDPAYLCGRLFAVFDRLQYLALGAVNAGVVERFYASASTTPSLVMGRLFRNAQFHLAKADGGIAGNARKDFEEITCALGDKFPPSLTLEEQGRFALGYYHQKAEYRRRAT